MDRLKKLFAGDIPPWIMKFVKEVGRGINEHNMIIENDKIIVGVSGGKDSMALALALALRLKWLPIKYSVEAILINWREHPISDNYRDEIIKFFEIIEIPFKILDFKMFPESFGGIFNCYLCARNRRRILFDYANNSGISKIAFGHHLDDLIETTLINLFHRAKFETMEPVSNFFDGTIKVLRPMCRVKESVTIQLNEYLNFPILNIACPYKEKNLRVEVKKIVHDMVKIDKLAKEHIYNAHFKER